MSPMPPGHYDLDACGGVHELPVRLSSSDRRQIKAALEQARADLEQQKPAKYARRRRPRGNDGV